MRVLIFLTGSLGDTLAALPAIWAVRTHWPTARVTLLCDAQIGESRVTPQVILKGAGLVDEFVDYPVKTGKRPLWSRIVSAYALWRILRRTKPDVLVYLIRAFAGDARVRRDLAFFRFAGVRSVVGASSLPKRPEIEPGEGMPKLPRLADLYLQQLAADGIGVPASGAGRMDLALNTTDQQEVEVWSKTKPADGGRLWIAFGVGSKMPSKLWPEERYAELGQRLIADHDIWPAIFGGAEDVELAKRLVAKWGRGAVAAGQLNIRAAAAALSRCRLYVGNDTGTMHLAAAAGIRCLAIFSARDFPGLWEPYGKGHVVFRANVPCAGCHLVVCNRHLECLTNISVEQVYQACVEMLAGA